MNSLDILLFIAMAVFIIGGYKLGATACLIGLVFFLIPLDFLSPVVSKLHLQLGSFIGDGVSRKLIEVILLLIAYFITIKFISVSFSPTIRLIDATLGSCVGLVLFFPALAQMQAELSSTLSLDVIANSNFYPKVIAFINQFQF